MVSLSSFFPQIAKIKDNISKISPGATNKSRARKTLNQEVIVWKLFRFLVIFFWMLFDKSLQNHVRVFVSFLLSHCVLDGD